MAQSIILPDGPLFIVDRGWKTPAGDFEIQIVPFGGKKRPQPSRRSLTSGPAAGLVKEPATDDATSQRNSENPRPRQKHKASSTPIQSFPFVNVTGPFQDQDAEARRLVRSHAMKGSRRSQRPRRTPSQRSTAVTAESGRLSPTQGTKDPQVDAPISLKLGSPLPGSATSFYGIIPCCMKPHFYGLLSYYLAGVAHSLYPLESHLTFNPVKASWFPLAITDELLLHTIMFSAAATLSFKSEKQQSTEASDIMKPIFRLLTSRLEDQSTISDATIGAVSCLAMVENMFGNHAKWKVHATGLREMVRAKGGMSSIEPGLQMKICRADIEGAVDSVSAPQLPLITRTHLPIYSAIQSTNAALRRNDLLRTLSSSNISPELRTILLDLSRFSQAIDFAFRHPGVSLHPKAFDEDIILIQHRLLSTPNAAESELATACRLGALIYVKTLTREEPFSPSSSKTLIPRLKSLLARITREPETAPLLLWLYFMGGIASRALAARSWFTNKLLEFVLLPGELLAWMSVKRALKGILWIELIHESPCKQLWDEIEVARTTPSIG